MAAMPLNAPWARPTSRQENTPVGTTRASARSEMCCASCRLGAAAASDSATGATAIEVMIAATAKPVTANGSKLNSNT